MKQNVCLTLLPVFWPNLPPIGLASLKGFLAANGIPVEIQDFNNYFYNKVDAQTKKQWSISSNTEFENDCFDYLNKIFPDELAMIISKLASFDIVGFSCYKSNIATTIKVSRLLKERKPDIKIIFGGPEITLKYLQSGPAVFDSYPNADLIVAGEGEQALLDFINGSNNRIAAFKEISDPQKLELPDYSKFDLNDYPRKSSICLMYSRGCIRKCSFCSEKLLYKSFRTFPIEKIIKFISKYKENGINNFIFNDSLINGDLKEFEKLLEEIIKNFVYINWEAQIAIRKDMPDSLFVKMKQSGCYNLFVGLESGSDNVLKKMKKGFTTKDALKFFEILHKHELNFGVSLITGFPEETEIDYKDSVDFIIKNKDLIKKIEQINPFVYYEGTNLDKNADYRVNHAALDRTNRFIESIKSSEIKYTNAFVKNLTEPKFRD